MVIIRNFAQGLRGSWESRILSFMSLDLTTVEIFNTSCFEPNLQEVVI